MQDRDLTLTVFCIVIAGIIFLLHRQWQKRKSLRKNLSRQFPESWKDILQKKVLFYSRLNQADQGLFDKRVQLFLATKIIKGVDADIDDAIRLMVASSAIIPTFAFPEYNYPHVHTILIYPNSFDEKFQTQRYEGHKEVISGMVGSSFSNSTVILSKPELVKAFDGFAHKENVGIHEFVHLLDKDDGIVDGIPELLISHAFVGPWLHEIKKEIKRIESGKSDINPYALTDNAEFLAVVSEYFFDNPEKFQRKHPELYSFLAAIFNSGKQAESSN